MNILYFYEMQCIILLKRNQCLEMSSVGSNFCTVLGLRVNYFTPYNLHFLLQGGSKISLFVCTGFRLNQLVYLFSTPLPGFDFKVNSYFHQILFYLALTLQFLELFQVAVPVLFFNQVCVDCFKWHFIGSLPFSIIYLTLWYYDFFSQISPLLWSDLF